MSGGEVAGLIVAMFWAILVCFLALRAAMDEREAELRDALGVNGDRQWRDGR